VTFLWTDHAVETRDYVNLIYFFAFLVRNMFLGFGFEIHSLARYLYFLMEHIRREIKFKTLMNRSPLNRPEQFFAAKSKLLYCLFE